MYSNIPAVHLLTYPPLFQYQMFIRPIEPKRPTQDPKEAKEERKGGGEGKGYARQSQPVPEGMGRVLENDIDYHSSLHPTPTHLAYK